MTILRTRSASRVLATALFGALAGGASLAVAFTRNPGFSFDMDRALPRTASGFYPAERTGNEIFRWTAGRAGIALPGLDRRSPWSCAIRLRGGRPAGAVPPVVHLAIDGVTSITKSPTNEYEDLSITVPPRTLGPGLTLTITTIPPFVPGHGDRRELGVQISRLVCEPGGAGFALPPSRALTTAALRGALFGAAFGVTGITVWAALGATLLVAIAQAVPLSTGPALYDAYQDKAIWIAIWTALAMLVSVRLIETVRRQALSLTATIVILYASSALYLKLLALLHPSKRLVDAVFHAHRLEWVMDGRFYFTQPMPNGVQFPYAIALYLFSAPWTVFTRNYVTLLRVVVCASEAVAGALLYLLIVRTWGDKAMGVVAVVLFSLVPLPYVIVGNANLTNAFGQSAALVTIIAATLWPLRAGQWLQVAGLAFLASLAFLSHVHTFALLLAALLALAFFYRAINGTIQASARSVFLATIIAAIFSIGAYYGQFGEVYKTLGRVRASAIGAVAPSRTPPGEPETSTTLPVEHAENSAGRLYDRAVRALAAGVRAAGWPIYLLTIVGIWRVFVDAARDRLGLALAAWGAAYFVFLVVAVLSPVDERFQRYAAEFVGRVNYATLPAAVLLAARGGIWAWRAGLAPRLLSLALLVGAVFIGVQQWAGWLR